MHGTCNCLLLRWILIYLLNDLIVTEESKVLYGKNQVIQKYNHINRKPNQTFDRLIRHKGSIVKS